MGAKNKRGGARGEGGGGEPNAVDERKKSSKMCGGYQCQSCVRPSLMRCIESERYGASFYSQNSTDYHCEKDRLS
jgi:hypothetical protein